MALDINNITAFDHLEAARRINTLILTTSKSGSMDHEMLMTLMTGQARNLAAVEDLLTAKIAEYNELPDEVKAALDRMADDGVNSVEIELPGPNDGEQDETVIYAKFGSKPRGGRNDS